MKQYSTLANKQSDTGGTTVAVQTLSKLNAQIYAKKAFTERIKLWCDFIRAGTNEDNGSLSQSSWYIIPITCEPG